MKLENANDLRNELLNVFADVKSGKLKPIHAVEMNNAAGKVINLSKLQMEYSVLRKEAPSIPFLDAK